MCPERCQPSMEKLPGNWRQNQSRSRMITPMQDRFIVLLSRRNHTSTAEALEIDFRRAIEVHLNDQTFRNKLHDDDNRG